MPEGKAESFLVPFNNPYAAGERWGPGPYYRIGVVGRGTRTRPGPEAVSGYYHSMEMLATLHKEIGALLAKHAHAQTQQ